MELNENSMCCHLFSVIHTSWHGVKFHGKWMKYGKCWKYFILLSYFICSFRIALLFFQRPIQIQWKVIDIHVKFWNVYLHAYNLKLHTLRFVSILLLFLTWHSIYAWDHDCELWNRYYWSQLAIIFLCA